MVILNNTTPEFSKAVELYKRVFCDSDSFIRTIMDTVIVATVDVENGEVVSCVFAREKQIRIDEKVVKIPFLFGIATNENYRGQNRASKIIEEMLSYLETIYDFVLLCPANSGLYSFYYRFGFEKLCFFDYKQKTISNGYEIVDAEVSDSQVICEMFNDFNQKNKVAQYRTPEAMQVKLREIISDEGEVKLVKRNNKTIGYYLFDEMVLESINVAFDDSNTGMKVVELSESQKEVDECPGVVIKKFKDVNLKQIKFYEMW